MGQGKGGREAMEREPLKEGGKEGEDEASLI